MPPEPTIPRSCHRLLQHLDEALETFWTSQRAAAIADEKGPARWNQPLEIPPPDAEESAVRLFADPLIRGTIDAVINQDPGHEVRSAIRVLIAKADNVPLIESQERIRIDIFLRDNLP